MKTITLYECEICHFRHDNNEIVRECEALGPTKERQRGTIFNKAGDPKNFYTGMTFVVAKNHIEGHSNYLSLWGFRDNAAGDSRNLGDQCSSGGVTFGKDDKPSTRHPTFKRALAFLRRYRIKPYVWDGTKSVPYKR